jgi:hypothetical protein
MWTAGLAGPQAHQPLGGWRQESTSSPGRAYALEGMIVAVLVRSAGDFGFAS